MTVAQAQRDLDYLMIDADTHYYEPADCFTRFMDPKLRESAITIEINERGFETITWNGKQLEIVEPGFFHKVLRPGSLKEMMQAVKKGLTFAEAGVQADLVPEWTSRPERLKVIRKQGLEATFLFPTLGVLWEHHLRSDPQALYANLHGFNQWLYEDWSYALDGLYGAPLLSLRDPELAVQELEWVLERGARIACMKPGHAYGRSPAHPIFDPFWARVEEAGLVIGYHIGESGYNEQYSVDFSELPDPPPNGKSALQWSNFYGDRPIMDTFASLVMHNLFGRFPGLRMISVENGSMWVPYLLAVMDKMKGMGRNGRWVGGRVDGRPSDIFKRHIYVSPYPEEDVQALVDAIGADRVLMGSDFPHPEGVAEPAELADRTKPLGEFVQRRFLRDNAYELLHPGA
ncbi:amidohydrolase family protein [uncultured Jatrophihabitans sp.]|uniref:amidohydrolase family protein n=1 Tax=uncultured Jatrophihabitans sp. TaxID=1610747 RepID=UPI0035CA288C